MELWRHVLIAFSLMLVLEGIIPFLYPQRWRQMVAKLADIDNRQLRNAGFISMLCGVVLLYIVN